MTPTFLAIAAAAVAVAVFFVVAPLLRKPQAERANIQRELDALDERIDELDASEYAAQRKALRSQLQQIQEPRSVGFAMIATLALLVPIGTALLYTKVGEPDALSPENPAVAELRAELIRIANRLERDPDDFEQWARLGMAYKAIEEFSSAAHALRRALYIDEQNPFIMVELAETLMFASQGARLPAESVNLLETAASLEPQNQKALWLLGIGAFQESNYQEALAWWQRLDRQLSDGSVRNSVREQMQRARVRLGDSAGASAELPPGHPSLEADAPGLAPVFLVDVALDPAFETELAGSETVFLIARAANGPRAPLAVQRVQVRDLPTTIALSDGDAMVDGLNLSNHTDIVLTARVSIGGTPEPQAGDLEGHAGPLSINEAAGARILINSRLTP